MFNPSLGEVDPSRRARKRSSAQEDRKVLPEPAHAYLRANDSDYGEAMSMQTLNRKKRNSAASETTREQRILSPVADLNACSSRENFAIDDYGFEEIDDDSANDDDDGIDSEEKDVYPNECFKSYTVVLGSFLSCFTLFGVMNAMGAIETYIENHQLAHESVTSVSWIFSIFMFFSLFSGLFVGPLYDTFGAKYLIGIGSLMTFVGNFATANCTEIYQFVLAFGLCTGIGTGFMMFPSVSVISSWFNRTKRSFFIGIAQCGGSVGGIAFPILLRYLYPKYGFIWAMRIFALFNLAVDVIALALIDDRIEEVRIALGEEKDNRAFMTKLKSSFDINAFKDKQFLALTCGLFWNEFSILIVLTYLASYAISYGATEAESFLMLTILNVTGSFGKFIPSYFSQRFGTFNMMILMSFTMSFTSFVIWVPFGGHKAALYLFIVLFGFAMASTYALTGACVGTITKRTSDFGKRYGSAYAFVSFGNLISLPISGAFIVTKSSTDYDHMAIFSASTCLLATVLFLWARYTVVGMKTWVAI